MDGALTLEADGLRLDQAIGNLVDNALRYGGGEIELRASVVGDALQLHVLDGGEGFPRQFLAHAFERFSRAGPEGRSSGLGLAIVRTVARAHGGEAHAANRNEGGTDV